MLVNPRNALLQSSMTTHSSLSALLSHDDVTIDRSLDSHARFLASQIHASDTRRAWVDDISRQIETLEHTPLSPLGLSQSLPDSPNTFYDRMRAAQEGECLSPPRLARRHVLELTPCVSRYPTSET